MKRKKIENPTAVDLMAAPQASLGLARCPTCDGSGEISVDSMSMVGIPGGWMPDRCPDCNGSGNKP